MNLKVHEKTLQGALGNGRIMSSQAPGWVITANKLSDLYQFTQERKGSAESIRRCNSCPGRFLRCWRMSLWSHFTTDGACFSTMALLPGSQPRCAIRGDFASPRPLLRGTEKLEEARACFEQALLLRKSKGDQRGIISTQRALDVLRTSQLDERLHRVRVSQIRELQEFAAGVERDKAAVAAELTLVQNNGVVEDHVNKLKLMKRMG